MSTANRLLGYPCLEAVIRHSSLHDRLRYAKHIPDTRILDKKLAYKFDCVDVDLAAGRVRLDDETWQTSGDGDEESCRVRFPDCRRSLLVAVSKSTFFDALLEFYFGRPDTVIRKLVCKAIFPHKILEHVKHRMVEMEYTMATKKQQFFDALAKHDMRIGRLHMTYPWTTIGVTRLSIANFAAREGFRGFMAECEKLSVQELVTTRVANIEELVDRFVTFLGMFRVSPRFELGSMYALNFNTPRGYHLFDQSQIVTKILGAGLVKCTCGRELYRAPVNDEKDVVVRRSKREAKLRIVATHVCREPPRRKRRNSDS